VTDTVNEGNAAWLTAQFQDKDGALAVPTSATYRVDDLTTGAAVRASTALPAASEVEIALDATDTALQNEGNMQERRRVTVTGVYGDGDQVSEQFDFLVKNLSGV